MNISNLVKTRYTSREYVANEDEMIRKIRLKKPADTRPLPVETFVLETRTGDHIITWCSVPHPPYDQETSLIDTVPRSEVWSNDTRPLPTEPRQKLSGEMLPLVLRLCTCELAPGEECCCPIATCPQLADLADNR